MVYANVPRGFVRALIERPAHAELRMAADAVLRGADPTGSMVAYTRGIGTRELASTLDGGGQTSSEIIYDYSFGAIPVGQGGANFDSGDVFLDWGKSDRFLVSGLVQVNGRVPHHVVEKDQAYRIYSNPLIGGLGTPQPCLPTGGTSRYVGTTRNVQQKLDVGTLGQSGLDGSGVAIAIVDSGVYKPRLELLLGEASFPSAQNPPRSIQLDSTHSWRPFGLVTQPGRHRVGHGTMCAYDALIAAPKATVLDFPMLIARKVADHHSTSMADAAMLAFFKLGHVWHKQVFSALVVSNSWGLFHPCLEDFPPGHPYRFIDNPKHVFHHLVRALGKAGVDILFCGNNCGDEKNCAGNCASGTCLSKTDRMIMGANAYEDVLTVGGCDTDDRVVGYSSRGPGVAGLYQNKPDVVAYTHFLGSRAVATFVPDTGVSAACPVAAGCVAALRTRIKPAAVKPKDLCKALRDTAWRPGGTPPQWKPDFGYGVIRPVAAARALGGIP
jgi:hypothetical protein